MDKIKGHKLTASLVKYLIPCFMICAAGIFLIMALSDYFQRWYLNSRYQVYVSDMVSVNEMEFSQIVPEKGIFVCKMIRLAKIMLIPVWSVFCLWVTVKVFYRRELKAPIDVLQNASARILNDDLDFKVECSSTNELGALCSSFEVMRRDLYNSNYQLWKALEERKRLNSAFSHDLRTPITVLKGYTELVEKFDGKLSPEKHREILDKMSGQVERLERYTEKMSGVHKLEDIIPEEKEFSFGSLCAETAESGRLICGDTDFVQKVHGDSEQLLCTDRELVMQVFENLVSNAVRFADKKVSCCMSVSPDELDITVADDGRGFSEEALRKALQPFYRGSDENEREHFGLGLYICRLLCRKCGGDIRIENDTDGGGKVTAVFSVKKSDRR